MRHPVAVLVPTLAFLLLLGSPFLHVRFNAPDASILPPVGAVARGLRPAPGRSSARASSRRSSSPSGRTGPATDAGQPRGPVRLLAAARARTRGSRRVDSLRRRRSAADARRSTRCSTATPNGPRDRYVADRPRGDDHGRPDRLHPLHARTARTATRARRWSPTCATPASPLAPPAGDDASWSAAAPRTSPTWSTASGRTSRGPPCSSS